MGAEKRAPPFWCRSLYSTGASPVGAEKGVPAPLVHKPPLHRGKPGGGGEGRGPPFLCRSLYATGASPVGAIQRAQSGLALVGTAAAAGAPEPVWVEVVVVQRHRVLEAVVAIVLDLLAALIVRDDQHR